MGSNIVADDLVIEAGNVAQQALAAMPETVQRRVEKLIAEGAELEVRTRLRMAPRKPAVSLWMVHKGQSIELMQAADD